MYIAFDELISRFPPRVTLMVAERPIKVFYRRAGLNLPRRKQQSSKYKTRLVKLFDWYGNEVAGFYPSSAVPKSSESPKVYLRMTETVLVKKK